MICSKLSDDIGNAPSVSSFSNELKKLDPSFAIFGNSKPNIVLFWYKPFHCRIS